jgi:hypothetical protein
VIQGRRGMEDEEEIQGGLGRHFTAEIFLS